jgi:hypothetical protein
MEQVENANVHMHKSIIDPAYEVWVMYEGAEGYPVVKEALNGAIAAKADEAKIIFVDGERVGDDLVDEDQLLSIEAYEIALDIIKRNSESKEIELEALLFSIGLLENVNKIRAIEYTIKLLKDKYNIDYNNDLSDIDVTDEEIDRYIDMLKD